MNEETHTTVLREVLISLQRSTPFITKQFSMKYCPLIEATQKKIQTYLIVKPSQTTLYQIISIYPLLLRIPEVNTFIVPSLLRAISFLPTSIYKSQFIHDIILELIPIDFQHKPKVLQRLIHLINDPPVLTVLHCLIGLIETDAEVADVFVDVVLSTLQKAKTSWDNQMIQDTLSELLYYLTPSTKKKLCSQLRSATFKIFRSVIIDRVSNQLIKPLQDLYLYDLPIVLFKYLTYPIIFKESYAPEALILLHEIFSFNIEYLKPQFECYWIYLVNALECIAQESEEIVKLLPNTEIVIERIHSNLSSLCSSPQFCSILFENYDADFYCSNILQRYLKSVHAICSLRPFQRYSKIQNIFLSILNQLIQTLTESHGYSIELKEKIDLKKKYDGVVEGDMSIDEMYEKYKNVIGGSKAKMLYEIPFLDKTKISTFLFDENNKTISSSYLELCFKDEDVLNQYINVIRQLQLSDIQTEKAYFIDLCSTTVSKINGEENASVIEYNELFLLAYDLYWQYWYDKVCSNSELTNNKKYNSLEEFFQVATQLNTDTTKNTLNVICEKVVESHPHQMTRNPPQKQTANMRKYLSTKTLFSKPFSVTSNVASNVAEILLEYYKTSLLTYHDFDGGNHTLLLAINTSLATLATNENQPDLLNLIIQWYIQESQLLTSNEPNLSLSKTQKVTISLTELLVNNTSTITQWKDITKVLNILHIYDIIKIFDSVNPSRKQPTLKQKYIDADTSHSFQKIINVFPLKLNDSQLTTIIKTIVDNLFEEKREDYQKGYHALLQHIVCINKQRFELYWEVLLQTTLSYCLKEVGVRNGKILSIFVLSLTPFLLEEYSSNQSLMTSYFLFLRCLDQTHFDACIQEIKLQTSRLLDNITSLCQQSIPQLILMFLHKFPSTFVILSRPYISITDFPTLQVIVKQMKNIHAVIGSVDFFEYSVVIIQRIFTYAPFPFHPASPQYSALHEVTTLQFECVLSKNEGTFIFQQFFQFFQPIFRFYTNYISPTFYLTVLDIAQSKCDEFEVSNVTRMYLIVFIVRFVIDNFKRIECGDVWDNIKKIVEKIIGLTVISDKKSVTNTCRLLNAFFMMLESRFESNQQLDEVLREIIHTFPLTLAEQLQEMKTHPENVNFNEMGVEDELYDSAPRQSIDVERPVIQNEH